MDGQLAFLDAIFDEYAGSHSPTCLGCEFAAEDRPATRRVERGCSLTRSKILVIAVEVAVDKWVDSGNLKRSGMPR